MSSRPDIFKEFLDANSDTEPPAIYYRWCLLSTIGALLGRNTYLNHGHFKIFPNLYTMLIGTAGARKSTPIKLCKKLLRLSGYETIAADKTSKEKFLVDLAGGSDSDNDASPAKLDDILDQNLFGDQDDTTNREMFIMADEANDFFGHGNIEFLSLLGNLWDYEGNFTYRIKTGKSLSIHNPSISILSANTPTGFAMAFPSEVLGQGFFSRLMLIHGEPSGRKIAFPKGMSEDLIAYFVSRFQEIRGNICGPLDLDPDAEQTLEKIYATFSNIGDQRFESYSTRRFAQLLKLCIIHCAARCGTSVSREDVIKANTVLSHAERYMPKALGEFGKSRNSDISHKIVELISSRSLEGLVSFKVIFTEVQRDLEKPADLMVLLQSLMAADRIQQISLPSGETGFMPKKKVVEQVDTSLLDLSYLTEEELGMSL